MLPTQAIWSEWDLSSPLFHPFIFQMWTLRLAQRRDSIAKVNMGTWPCVFLPPRTLCSRRDWPPCYNCWSLTCLPSSLPGAEGLPRLNFQVDISNQHAEQGWHGSSQVSWFLKEWKASRSFLQNISPNHLLSLLVSKPSSSLLDPDPSSYSMLLLPFLPL